MDTVTVQSPVEQATQPVQDAYIPVSQPDVSTQPEAPRLDQQGEHQAPAPTSGDEGGAPDTSATPPVPEFNAEEYLRIKQEHEQYQRDLQEKDDLLANIRRMAEEQQAAQQQQELRASLQKQVTDRLRKAGVEDDDVAASIAEFMYGEIDSTRTSYQSQMTQYQQQVDDYAKNAIWSATRDGYADWVIKEYKLDPVIRPRLLQASSDHEMKMIADALREAQTFYQRQAYDRTVQDQEQQRRASGVDAFTGSSSGPIPSEGLKPGKNLDVLSAILSGR